MKYQLREHLPDGRWRDCTVEGDEHLADLCNEADWLAREVERMFTVHSPGGNELHRAVPSGTGAPHSGATEDNAITQDMQHTSVQDERIRGTKPGNTNR